MFVPKFDSVSFLSVACVVGVLVLGAEKSKIV